MTIYEEEGVDREEKMWYNVHLLNFFTGENINKENSYLRFVCSLAIGVQCF